MMPVLGLGRVAATPRLAFACGSGDAGLLRSLLGEGSEERGVDGIGEGGVVG